MTPSEPVLNSLGDRIRTLRRARGWTQKHLCLVAGLSTRFLGQLETGQGNVSIGRLVDVAAALEVSLVSLVAGVGPVSDPADALAAHACGLDRAGQLRLMSKVGPGRAQKVSLIGMRGAGKSTIGRRAAVKLGWDFVHVDAEVERLAGLPLSDLFEMHGTAGYHRWCCEVISELMGKSGPAVLEIGGSVVLDPEAWAVLDEHTSVIWLRATPEAHLERVAGQGDRRPMGGRGDAIAQLRVLLSAREPFYRRASLQIDTVVEGISGAVATVVSVGRENYRVSTPA